MKLLYRLRQSVLQTREGLYQELSPLNGDGTYSSFVDADPLPVVAECEQFLITCSDDFV